MEVDPAPSSPSRNEAESSEPKITPQGSQTPQQQQACKSEDYRKLFHLPVDEVLVQDFNCAFQKKILLQGHMYLFEQYICFYSNIFGYEKKKVLPLKDVVFVRKAWTAGLFPNAIEIGAWGKKYFFASFLSRDEAYRLIVNGWSRYSSHARVLTESPSLGASSEPLVNQSQVTPASVSARNSDATEQEASLAEDDEEKEVLPKPEQQNEWPVCEKDESLWKIEDALPPPLPSEFKTILEIEFPVDVEDFFQLFFSDNAISFTETFHKRCNDEEFRSTQWSSHPRFGHARDISFRHPVNLYFGPKSAVCTETQKFRVYRNCHLIIESSQQMSDIPYADYFHVQVRWDVERVSKEVSFHSFVRVSMNVEFSKRTVWRGKIEQATLDECKETYSLWVREAYQVLSSRNSSEEPVNAEPAPLLTEEPAKSRCLVPAELARPDNERTRNRSKLVSRFVASMRTCVKQLRILFSENPMTALVLLIAVLAILTQAFTLMAIAHSHPARVSTVNFPDKSFTQCLGGSNPTVEALSWLEQRARYVKEEITLAEARLQSLHQDLSILKLHMNLFEQFKSN